MGPNENDFKELPEKEFKRMIITLFNKLKENESKEMNEIKKPINDSKIECNKENY